MFALAGQSTVSEPYIVPPIYEGNGGSVVVTATTSINIPYPSSISTNDILVVQLLIDNTNPIASSLTSAGFALITNNTGGLFRNSYYWKRATGSESGNLSVSFLAPANLSIAVMHRYSGAPTTGTPYQNLYDSGYNYSGTGSTLSGQTTSANNSLAVAFWGLEDNNTTTVTLNGWTQNFSYSTATSTDMYGKAFSKIQETPGTPPNLVLTWAGTDYFNWVYFELLGVEGEPPTWDYEGTMTVGDYEEGLAYGYIVPPVIGSVSPSPINFGGNYITQLLYDVIGFLNPNTILLAVTSDAAGFTPVYGGVNNIIVEIGGTEYDLTYDSGSLYYYKVITPNPFGTSGDISIKMRGY